MDHLSPKLGIIYKLTDQLNAYAAYRHAFRIPSESQLFRSGSTSDSTDLQPVTADSIELGLRGQLTSHINFEVTVYDMSKDDEIINVTDETGARRNVNAGDTTHRGIEAGMDWLLTNTFGVGISYSRNKHRFNNWIEGTNDFSGNTMPNAPKYFANVRLHYTPTWLNGGRLEAEWTDQGEYFIDEANNLTYPGHALLNLRGSYALNETVEIYLNILNAEDKLYAESTGKFGPTYTPGRPRTIMGGVRFTW
jgi:iron complex outermembrane receptor protein